MIISKTLVITIASVGSALLTNAMKVRATPAPGTKEKQTVSPQRGQRLPQPINPSIYPVRPVKILPNGAHSLDPWALDSVAHAGAFAYIINKGGHMGVNESTALLFVHSVRTWDEETTFLIPPDLPYVVYDAQFSPDGRYVLFKAGDHIYCVYRLDLQTRQMEYGPQASEAIGYPTLWWAPDSHFIAYLKNTPDSNLWRGGLPTLCVYDFATHRSQVVSSQLPFDGGIKSEDISWTAQHTLLYTVKAPPYRDRNRADNDSYPSYPNPSSCDIYERALSNGKSHLLLTQARCPNSSPDGRYIAFVGWYKTAQPRSDDEPSGYPAYYLWDRKTQQRIFLAPLDAQICWTPDSQHLVMLYTAGPKIVIADMEQFEGAQGFVSDAKMRTLNWQQAKKDWPPQLQHISPDGTTVFMTARSNDFLSLFTVNLKTGVETPLAEFKKAAVSDAVLPGLRELPQGSIDWSGKTSDSH